MLYVLSTPQMPMVTSVIEHAGGIDQTDAAACASVEKQTRLQSVSQRSVPVWCYNSLPFKHKIKHSFSYMCALGTSTNVLWQPAQICANWEWNGLKHLCPFWTFLWRFCASFVLTLCHPAFKWAQILCRKLCLRLCPGLSLIGFEGLQTLKPYNPTPLNPKNS